MALYPYFLVTHFQKNLFYDCKLYKTICDSNPNKSDNLIKSGAIGPFAILVHFCFDNR